MHILETVLQDSVKRLNLVSAEHKLGDRFENHEKPQLFCLVMFALSGHINIYINK